MSTDTQLTATEIVAIAFEDQGEHGLGEGQAGMLRC
jgi:hypothetical protein